MKIIDGVQYFSKSEVAALVNRTPLTIQNYAKWSDEREEQGLHRFIPKPKIIGNYRFWNLEQIEQIKEFLLYVANNRGCVAEYSKRLWVGKGFKGKEEVKHD